MRNGLGEEMNKWKVILLFGLLSAALRSDQPVDLQPPTPAIKPPRTRYLKPGQKPPPLTASVEPMRPGAGYSERMARYDAMVKHQRYIEAKDAWWRAGGPKSGVKEPKP